MTDVIVYRASRLEAEILTRLADGWSPTWQEVRKSGRHGFTNRKYLFLSGCIRRVGADDRVVITDKGLVAIGRKPATDQPAPDDWRCAGCGAPGQQRSCDCATDVVYRYVGQQITHAIKKDKPDQQPEGISMKKQIEEHLNLSVILEQYSRDGIPVSRERWMADALALLLRAELARVEQHERDRVFFEQRHAGNIG
jgi:hypothetical protein